MSLIMTKQEREAFLADVHVGIISISDDGRGPLTVPVWYAYDSRDNLRIMTGRESRKGRLLARAGRFSLCVQTESPPYKYVSVEGAIISTEAADIEARSAAPSRAVISEKKWATAMWRRRETYLPIPTTCSSACVRNDG